MNQDSMQVAVRIRPMAAAESNRGCRACLEKVRHTPQVIVGLSDFSFTYNYVFDEYDGQVDVYSKSVEPLIPKLFEGYNVTVLAYGQTGSGKTYTMGTNYSGHGEMGIIQRSVIEIFEKIHANNDESSFEISVSFLELYNETLYDLLTDCERQQSIVELRDNGNVIHIPGLTKRSVSSASDTLSILLKRSSLRVTGETAMNATSSRSHAIFTINVKVLRGQKGFTNSKFHLVDLAGSERAKKTQTTGDRFKEGININKGLLSLGNVISQLGDASGSFVNYRDSLLTRLLRDSLGGNSFTLMIACVSPADTSQSESLSTLRYADRVKKIKNKPMVNMDPQTGLIAELRKEVEVLKLKIISGNSVCPPSHYLLEENLKSELKKSKKLKSTLKSVIFHNSALSEKNVLLENMIDSFMGKINDLENQINNAKSNPTESLDSILDKFSGIICEIKNENQSTGKKIIDLSKEDDYDDLPDAHSEMPDEVEELFLISQTENNKQISLISKSLLAKQELVDKITSNHELQNWNDSSANVEILRDLITKILSEKENLVMKYERETKKSNSNEINEEYKSKLRSVERELSIAQKKLAEQEKIIKLKAKSDEQIVKLRREIQSLKQMKVKLVRDMKQENDKYKNWLNEKNKEVVKLRNLTNRQSTKINKMEEEFTLRQVVWRRKLELAASAKKRMVQAMDRQRLTTKKQTDSAKVEEYIEAEVELLESALCAKHSFKKLLDGRAALSHELADIHKELETSLPDSRKAFLTSRENLLKEDLELHNAQIADLQMKIIDFKQSKTKLHVWENIQSVREAKLALSSMMSAISRLKKESICNTESVSELQAVIEVKNSELQELNDKIKLKETEKAQISDDITKFYEDKLFAFHANTNFNQMKSNTDSMFTDAYSRFSDSSINRNNIELPQKRKCSSIENTSFKSTNSDNCSNECSKFLNTQKFDHDEWKNSLLVRSKKPKVHAFFSDEDILKFNSENKENKSFIDKKNSPSNTLFKPSSSSS